MSDSDDTVETAYGRLDRAALVQAQHTYDTTILLRMVDDLDAMLGEARTNPRPSCSRPGVRFATRLREVSTGKLQLAIEFVIKLCEAALLALKML